MPVKVNGQVNQASQAPRRREPSLGKNSDFLAHEGDARPGASITPASRAAARRVHCPHRATGSAAGTAVREPTGRGAEVTCRGKSDRLVFKNQLDFGNIPLKDKWKAAVFVCVCKHQQTQHAVCVCLSVNIYIYMRMFIQHRDKYSHDCSNELTRNSTAAQNEPRTYVLCISTHKAKKRNEVISGREAEHRTFPSLTMSVPEQTQTPFDQENNLSTCRQGWKCIVCKLRYRSICPTLPEALNQGRNPGCGHRDVP